VLTCSFDEGLNWKAEPLQFKTMQNASCSLSGNYLEDLLYSPFVSKTVYADVNDVNGCPGVRGAMLLQSNDLGATWTAIDDKPYQFHTDPALPNQPYAFNRAGIKTLT